MDTIYNPQHYPSILAPFKAVRSESGYGIWANNNAFRTDVTSIADEYNLLSVYTDTTHTKKGSPSLEVYAERYGGFGGSKHAGSARSANYDGVQLKGLGLTPVAGKAASLSHSTGTLNLIDGLLETLFSVALNQLLPHGAVPIHAVIGTGRKDAHSGHLSDFTDGKDVLDTGCILVREAVLRPAHFMYATFFEPLCEHSVDANQADQIARVHAEFIANAGGPDNALFKFAEFLKITARQFAYARVFGLMHGSLSYSNYSMDGRWLDLACATTVGGYHNYAIGGHNVIPSFSTEAEFVLNISENFCWEFGKHIQRMVDPSIFSSIYNKHYIEARGHFCLEFWGFDAAAFYTDEQFTPYACTLINETLTLLSISKERLHASPSELIENDPIVAAVMSVSQVLGIMPCQHSDVTDSPLAMALLDCYNQSNLGQSRSYIAFQQLAVLRRVLLWPVLYRDSILTTLKDIVWSNQHEQGGALIEEMESFVRWAFKGSEDLEAFCVFNTKDHTIRLDSHFNIYCNDRACTALDAFATIQQDALLSPLLKKPIIDRYLSCLSEITQHVHQNG
ncbi:hypothetical protein [Teredinibacter purpureus]|uniref:hypothetical protein n=1 Tax=Teredinibacter purpureus TaxID=2731756 RepID=UPI0005F79F12|nr:hypothetical protein [Teredinibacter purpureus]